MMKRLFLIPLVAGMLVLFFSCETEKNIDEAVWTEVESPTTNWLLDIHFVDDVSGWAVGKNGTVLKTVNGEDWESVTISGITDHSLYGVAFSDNEHGVLIGHGSDNQAIAYATRNGGNTWTKVSLPATDFTPREIAFSNESQGWISGSNGIMLNTTDAGQTWHELQTPVGNTLYGLETVGDNKVYVCGSSTLLYSSDGGDNWLNLIGEQDGYGWLQDVVFVNDDKGWIISAGGEGKVYHTTDGGNNWKLQLDSEGKYLNGIDVFTESKGWTVGESGMMFHTEDGENWTKVESPTGYDLNAVFFTSETNGWAAGYKGTLLHFN